MKKTIYYQAQYSKDGKTWYAFNAHKKYNTTDNFEEIKAVYNEMLQFHSLEWNADCKYHRIARYEVIEMIINL